MTPTEALKHILAQLQNFGAHTEPDLSEEFLQTLTNIENQLHTVISNLEKGMPANG